MQLNLNPSQIDIKQDIKKLFEFDNEGICDYLNDSFTFNKGILISDKGLVIGAGVLRVLNEFKMTLDPTLSDYQKAKAIKMLMKVALEKSQCNEILLKITKDIPKFSSLLMTHYNFEITPGLTLRLEK